jgi:small GTP-binding protein
MNSRLSFGVTLWLAVAAAGLLTLILIISPTLAGIVPIIREWPRVFSTLAAAGILILSALFIRRRYTRARSGRILLDGRKEEDAVRRQRASKAIEKLAGDLNLTDAEQALCTPEIEALKGLRARLAVSKLSIALVGIVGTGKSSIFNRLLGAAHSDTTAVHGTTTTELGIEWTQASADGAELTLIDTPGIAEVDGEERERRARLIAERADVIVFVVSGDLTQPEFDWIALLGRIEHKPIIVAFNKVDLYTDAQRNTLGEVLRKRLSSIVPTESIVETKADPQPRKVVRIDRHGNEEEVVFKAEADVSRLQRRLLEVAGQDGAALLIASVLLSANRVADSVRGKVTEMRDSTASKIILTYTNLSAAHAALNPVPIADLLVDVAINGKMVYDIARAYSVAASASTLSASTVEVTKAAAAVGVTAQAAKYASSLIKAVPVVGWLVGGITQGLVAGYTTNIVGRTFQRYFRSGSEWAQGGVEEAVRLAINETNTVSVLEMVRDGLLSRFQASLDRRNRSASIT